jgi:hypothetical protein
MKMPLPPYTTRLLKSSAEFVAELTPEKLDDFIEPVPPGHNGDDWSTESVQRLADARGPAAEHLPAISQRIDALYDALDEGWCAPRGIENQIDHLHRALSPYHLSRYLKDALATLQEAEADLAIWQRMTEAQRDECWAEHERDEAERAERRQKAAEISKQQDAFYSAFFAMGISPIPMSAESIAESARALNETERQISNMGNHLYE